MNLAHAKGRIVAVLFTGKNDLVMITTFSKTIYSSLKKA